MYTQLFRCVLVFVVSCGALSACGNDVRSCESAAECGGGACVDGSCVDPADGGGDTNNPVDVDADDPPLHDADDARDAEDAPDVALDPQPELREDAADLSDDGDDDAPDAPDVPDTTDVPDDTERDGNEDPGTGDVIDGDLDTADTEDADEDATTDTDPDVEEDTTEDDTSEDDTTPDVVDDGDVAPAVLNACGGFATLRVDGIAVTPGDPCGWLETGVLTCGGPDALVCTGELGPNACGGDGLLPGDLGMACGCDGQWACDETGSAICLGNRGRNACGGCDDLDALPGYACGEAGELWQCQGPDAVRCVEGGNACGGTFPLAPSGARPGAACLATCGDGVWACDGLEGLVCQPFQPCNSCGGSEPLLGDAGAGCGVFGDGEWTCSGPDAVYCADATVPNACGGPLPLTGAPGTSCGGGRSWVCLRGATVCVAQVVPDLRNACGGGLPLDADPGAACGACGDGVWVCEGLDALRCSVSDADQRNDCGGCDSIVDAPGGACGVCGDGVLACEDDNEALRCAGATALPNVCGGCGALPGVVGERCGPCGTWACSASGRMECQPLAPTSCLPPLSCADIGCAAANRTCVPPSSGVDARCTTCLPGFDDEDGTCLVPLGVPTGVQASDGVDQAVVRVTWEATAGATGYHVYRNGVRLTLEPLAAEQYADAEAPAPGAPGVPQTLTASTDRADDVLLTWAQASAPVGAAVFYTVTAVRGASESARSAEDAGYRAAWPVLGYDVEADGSWTDVGETFSSVVSAPAGTIALGLPTASRDRGDGVALATIAASVTAGSAATYRVRARNAAGPGAPTAAVSGRRAVGEVGYQWEFATDSAGPFGALSGAVGTTWLDTTAPLRVDRWYRVVASAGGATVRTSDPVAGYRLQGCRELTCTAQGRECLEATDGNDASCGGCLPTHDPVGETCVAAISAPTNVAATDGTRSLDVTVTWTGVTGATAYRILRDGVVVATVGSGIRTYADTSAPPGPFPAPVANLVVTRTPTATVTASWDAAVREPGPIARYQVVAVVGTRTSPPSVPDDGYRAPFTISRYEVSTGGSWTSVGANRTYAVPSPPVGTFDLTPWALVASDARTDGVLLAVTNGISTSPTPVTVSVRIVVTDQPVGEATSAVGWRVPGAIQLQWQRALADAGPFLNVGGGTTTTFLDTLSPSGRPLYYRLVASAEHTASYTSPTVPAYRVPLDVPLELGAPCAVNADCPASTWCPTDTEQTRCAPIPNAGTVPMPFQYVPAGTFLSGTGYGTVGRQPSGAEEQYPLTLTRAFFLQRTEVTQAQWQSVFGTLPSSFLACGPNCPVESVSPHSVYAFANALSLAEGLPPCYNLPTSGCSGSAALGTLVCSGVTSFDAEIYRCSGYRLPTRPEAQYASRAGTLVTTYAGELLDSTRCTSSTTEVLNTIAWFCQNNGSAGSPTHGTKGVGTKLPNAWGFFDLLGNVSEYVHDSPQYPGRAVDPGRDAGWVGVHGGYWGSTPQHTRSVSSVGVADRSNQTGFRLTRTAPLAPDAACPVLTAPTHGSVDTEGAQVGATARFACLPGHALIGESLLACLSSQQWSHPAPTCSPRAANLGGECAADADCGPTEWCPTATVHRRCSPRAPIGPRGLPMQFVPAGSYQMGSPVGEYGRATDEVQVSVVLTHNLFVQPTELTREQYESVLGLTPSSIDTSAQPRAMRWWSALAVANALSEADGLAACYVLPTTGCSGSFAAGTLSCGEGWPALTAESPYDCTGYRLPTDAEWEYVARAGTTGATFVGTASNDTACAIGQLYWPIAWCRPQSGTIPLAAVAFKLPNAWGLFDTAGNLAEWTWSPPTPTHLGGTNPDPRVPSNLRGARGGSVSNSPAFVRVAARGSASVTSGSPGVRFVRTAPPTPPAP